MKNLKLSFIAVLFVSVVFVAGCSDDDPIEKVSPFVGKYTITKATSTSSLTLKTNEIGDIPVAAGTNITEIIQQALLSAITCTPIKSIIELRKDNSVYMFCDGSGSEINAGTWSEASDTEVKLNLNSTAVPSSPAGIALTIKNIVITNSKLTGETNVPLPKSMLAGIVSVSSGGLATLDEANTPDALSIDFSIEMTKR